MKCQHDFEAHIRSLDGDYNLLKVGDVYIDVETQIEWRTWQKAWQAALASQHPADDGWIELEEGAIPVHPETLVEIKMRNGATDGPGKAGGFLWYIGNEVKDEMGCDIIAYRVVKP